MRSSQYVYVITPGRTVSESYNKLLAAVDYVCNAVTPRYHDHVKKHTQKD